MNCVPISLSKYQKRKGPPIPANNCNIGQKKRGNDGNMYQILSVKSKKGITNRWFKCGTGKTKCKKSKKINNIFFSNRKVNLPKLSKKYKTRPGPPVSAKEFNEGDIKLGNNGELYQNLLVKGKGGKILKWVKCGHKDTNC